MDPYEETFQTWNKIASVYAEKFMHLDLYNETYDSICQSISKAEANVLEIGCGPGNITQYLLSKRPDFNILGIDIASNMVEMAKKNNPTAHFLVMDSRKIGQLTSTYDGIVCGFCLPYLSPTDTVKLINDCSRLLNPGGLIYLSFVEGDPEKSGFQSGSTGDRSYFYFHNLEFLKAQLLDIGFHDLVTFHVEYNKSGTESETHTVLTAKKKI